MRETSVRRAASGLLSVALSLTLAACAVGPDYRRPEVATPGQFKEAPEGWRTASPSDGTLREDWWQLFGDAQLDALERRVAEGNFDLAAAAARQQQSAALLRQARAGFYPVATAQAGLTRSRTEIQGSTRTAAQIGNIASVSAGATWEPDLWGHVRRSVEAAGASAQASVATFSGTRLSLQAQLAQSYLLLRVADAQARLLDETVAGYQRVLTLTRNRYAGGVVTRADVAAAEAQLANAQAQRADATINRQRLEHAIAVLVGVAPADFTVAALDTLPPALRLPDLPAALPAELLERRPDVAAAEREAAAANAQIGVAESAYFPDLTLSASAGYRSGFISDLFSTPARVWSVGPALAATLFDGGERRAATEAARANYDAVAAQYKQTVLAAFQEVEDTLVALRQLEIEEMRSDESVRAARESLDLTTRQYQAGTVSFLNVVTAQNTLFSAQTEQLDVRGRQLTGTVTLVRALGGGWGG